MRVEQHPKLDGQPPRQRAARWVEEALAAGAASAWSWDAATGALELDRGAAVLGADPASLADLEALVHPDDRARRGSALQRAFTQGESWTCSFRLAASERRWVEERGRAVRSVQGKLLRAVALVVDVSDRRRAEEALEGRVQREARDRQAAEVAAGMAEAALRALARSEALLESMFSSMADALVLFDRSGRATRMNPTARAMLGVGEGQELHADLAPVRALDADGQVVPADRLPSALALQGHSTRGQALCFDAPDGRKLWVVAGAAPVRAPDGVLVGAVLSLGDVTTLRRQHEEREDLSRMISHDLRTPLNVILAHAKLLGRRVEGPEATRARAEAIATSAQRMATMLNDLVESALLEAGKLRLQLEPVDLEELVSDLRRRLAAAYGGERVYVVAQEDLPPVLADSERLERVVANLLTNALKYSAPASEVLVRLGAEDGKVVLRVEDRGQGIAPEDLPHLFERFFRALGTRRHDGMGLGLYTARRLIEAHGGAIGVSSVPGRGSTFWVSLPAASAPAGGAPGATPARTDGAER